MSKLCQTFQSPYSLRKTPCCFTLATYLLLSLSEFCGQIFENIFFFLDLIVQKIFFDKNHCFQLLSTKNDWIISLFLISFTLHSLSVSHSIMSSVCKKKKKKKKQSLAFDENYIALLSKLPNVRKFCFSVWSLSFFPFFCFRFLAYWDNYYKTWFDSLKHLQNVRSKSPQVTNIWIISFGGKVTWFTTA